MAETEKLVVWPGWTVVRELGHGSFGAVYEIEREDAPGHKEKAALKKISIPQSPGEIDALRNDGYDDKSITKRFESYLQDIMREYSLMSDLKGCSNVVYCDDVKYIQHEDGIGWDIYIKMELLSTLPKVFRGDDPEESAIELGMDICRALDYCAKRQIVHRDIKPQNIFVAPDGTYKLGDFGIAKTMERTTGGTKIGTYNYMAPEVYNNQPYGAKADLYSLGLVLYWMLNEKRAPFLPLPPETPTVSDEERGRARRFSGEELPAPKNGSEGLKRIVLKACAYDPKDRFTSAAEMLDALQNPAFYEDAPTTGMFGSPGRSWQEEEDKRRREEEKRRREEEERKKREEELLLREEAQRRLAEEQRKREDELRQEAAKRKKLTVLLAAIAAIAVVVLIVMLIVGPGKNRKDSKAPASAANVPASTAAPTRAPTPSPVPTAVPTSTPTPTPTAAPTPTPTPVPASKYYDFLSLLPDEPQSPYGTELRQALLTGARLTDKEKAHIVGDTYDARDYDEGMGYATKLSTKNDTGYDIGFYYADDLVFFAIVYTRTSPRNEVIKLHYWGDQIIAFRDYRTDHKLRYTDSAEYASVVEEFGCVFDIGMRMSR